MKTSILIILLVLGLWCGWIYMFAITNSNKSAETPTAEKTTDDKPFYCMGESITCHDIKFYYQQDFRILKDKSFEYIVRIRFFDEVVADQRMSTTTKRREIVYKLRRFDWVYDIMVRRDEIILTVNPKTWTERKAEVFETITILG